MSVLPCSLSGKCFLEDQRHITNCLLIGLFKLAGCVSKVKLYHCDQHKACFVISVDNETCAPVAN